MTNAEATLVEVFSKLGNPRFVTRILRSGLAWRLSGLSYPTAVVATTGTYESIPNYIQSFENRVSSLLPLINHNSTVLDFGTGLGGNLLGLSRAISSGVGIDINPFYIGQARRIARANSMVNLRFVEFDGREIPPLGAFDLIISTGAFERIQKSQARVLISSLSGHLKPSGLFVLHVLTARSRESNFSRLLGADAYTWWEERELDDIFSTFSLVPSQRTLDVSATGDTFVLVRKPGRARAGS